MLFRSILNGTLRFACLLALLAVSVSFLLVSCKVKPTLRSEKENRELTQVLFVGNSMTYENGGVDHQLRGLVEYSNFGNYAIIHSTTAGRYHLNSHFKDSSAMEVLRYEKWDKIVIQEYTRGPLVAPEEFQESSKAWKDTLKNIDADADLVFFSMWGYKKKKYMARQIFDKNNEVAGKVNGTVVPVGMFWEHLRKKVNLYDIDGAHPNRAGTFATACLFYEYLFDEDVRETAYLDELIDVMLQMRIKEWAHDYHQKHK